MRKRAARPPTRRSGTPPRRFRGRLLLRGLYRHTKADSPRQAHSSSLQTGRRQSQNSAALGGLLPVTIKFSRLVGQIMREIPRDREPLPQFKFYI